jgi:hypothetical protein
VATWSMETGVGEAAMTPLLGPLSWKSAREFQSLFASSVALGPLSVRVSAKRQPARSSKRIDTEGSRLSSVRDKLTRHFVGSSECAGGEGAADLMRRSSCIHF